MSIEQMMNTVMEETAHLPETTLRLTISKLVEKETSEVLAFLAERPIDTVCMIGFIQNNGLISELSRGTFYGCRNSEGIQTHQLL